MSTRKSRWNRAAVLAAWGMLAVWIAQPAQDSTIRLSGLKEPAEILVDRWGVPHIFAHSEADLFFVQGFNAARDRLFQIDLWRRRGLGQLAEVLGPDFIEQDRAARLFLYRGDMGREWRSYSVKGTRDAERMAAAFATGINEYIDYLGTHPDEKPWEFRQFGYEPGRWTASDVVRIRSHGLTRNLVSEVARAKTACLVDLAADAIRLGLQPPWETRIPEGLEVCLPSDILEVFQLATRAVRLAEKSLRADAGWQDFADEGSNNWVIAPRRSATGRAIMANDPHRAYAAPSLRYITHLAAPGLNVIGGGEPAIPGISIGHNGTIAFGLTIFPIDQEDLYVYELHPTDATRYRYKGGWERLRVIREEIRVKGGSPVAVQLSFTRHGPVIHTDAAKRRAYAVRSCWFEAGMAPYFSATESMRASSFEEFRNSMSHWGAPTLNHVYADVKGNIGWVARGLSPKRVNWDGLLPVPGDGGYEWAGFWRGDELPHVFNPAEGWFATANQLNLPRDYPYKERRLGFEWTNPSRYSRVAEVLGSTDKVSLEDCKRLQNDVLSIPARRLVKLLEGLNPADPKARAAVELLEGWDFQQQQGSAAAALFEVWQARHLRKAFGETMLPQSPGVLPSTDMRVLLEALETPGRFAGNQRSELFVTTLAAAYSEMETLQGSDSRKWQWGRLHYNLCEHSFSGAVDEATRGRINVGPLAKHGSEYTPNQSQYRGDDFRQSNGPSFRIIVDVGDWDNSQVVNHPGQSGNPESAHYRDLAPLWLRGEYFPLLYSRAAIERETERRIQLRPANNRD